MTIDEKISYIETLKGTNRPPAKLRQLLDTHIPETLQGTFIQIVGTNGKGSTTAWLALLADQPLTGTFTSPHLKTHFERIAINNKPIPPAHWERIYDKWAQLFSDNHFTMFEIDLWMALVWFHEQNVPFAIFEAGMGGTMDATTALDYAAQGITNIGLDHMAYLGNTLEEIALAKAGIMKKDTPVLTTEKAMLPILQQQAEKVGAPIIFVEPVPVPDSLPAYQTYNLALAKAILETIHMPAKQANPEQFFWPARYQTIQKEPLQIVDGAHNLPGITALVDSIPPVDRIYFSVLADKQAGPMIDKLKTAHIPITLVHFDTPRLADLTELATQYDLPIVDLETCARDIKSCLYCGSLYFAAAILKKKGL